MTEKDKKELRYILGVAGLKVVAGRGGFESSSYPFSN
jgi:hypothetical protein